MLRSVTVIAQEPLAPFEFGVLCEVFGVDRTDDGVPPFDFAVCAEDPSRPVPLLAGATLQVDRGLEACERADLVALPSGPMHTAPSPAVLDQVRAAVGRGAYVLSVCTGAFTLAESGVLSGRRCSTHWRYAEQLATTYPDVEVDADALYTMDGTVITSAGTAAGIDACLSLVRLEHGAEIAARIARRMVVAPHRDGGQQQFIERPFVPASEPTSLEGLIRWLLDHLDQEHSVSAMAAREHMSARTFARRFRAETGTTPHQWLTQQRVLAAQELLESTCLPLEIVAARVGLTSATLLRHHFSQIVGISPSTYRRRFAGV
ncbi:MAG: GlxA family transcriptional regulator [Ornithinimicrobium sp.]|uniref:GlxA family transcriptional regulator n=1 Tax=Ornithinimicrobium sp. TaxID=1977084 RepID=UPI003D9B5071